MHNSALGEKGKRGEKTFIFPSFERMSTLTPAWNKARHHILISNFRAFISPKCHPAGLVNYWQTDTNAKGHIKEAKSSGPGRACPLLLPSTGRQTLLMLLWKLTVTLRLKCQHMTPDLQLHHTGEIILCSVASLVCMWALVQLQGHQGKAVNYLIKSWKLKVTHG